MASWEWAKARGPMANAGHPQATIKSGIIDAGQQQLLAGMRLEANLVALRAILLRMLSQCYARRLLRLGNVGHGELGLKLEAGLVV